MSVMNKPDYKIFAQDAKSGEYVAFPDILRGWGITLDQYNGFPPMELFNSAAKRIDEWLMYLTQRGLPEWDAAVDYPKDAMIQHAGVYYVSLKVTKGEQPNNSQASWKKLTEALGVDGKLAKDQNGADIPNKPKFIENLGLPEKYQPTGTYADGKVFKALAGDGASIEELTKKFVFALKEDGTVALYSRDLGRFLWAIEQGRLANKTGQDSGLIMSQKAVTDELNLLTPLSSFTRGSGWAKFPDGTIIQQGIAIAGQLKYPTTIQFPIPFTSKPTVVACFDSASNAANDCPSFATSPAGVGLSAFYLMSSRPSGGESAGANWIAIGR